MMNKKHPTKDKAREHRIDYEIIIDCYDEIEQMLGWWYYLDNTLEFPFTAKCIENRSISPLKISEIVEVIAMGALEDCGSDMFVIVKLCGREFGVPIAQLEPAKSYVKAKQAFEDWQYWSQL